MEDRWISLEEASEYLGVNKDTIRNWIRKNKGIPAHKQANYGNSKKQNQMLGLRVGKVQTYKGDKTK